LQRHAAARYEENVRPKNVVVIGWLLVGFGCGGASAPGGGATSPEPAVAGSSHHAVAASAGPVAMNGGSSDGTTCEQARDQYTEEINIGASSGADLKAEDFAAVLNNGTYLNSCDVPTASKVRICAAVQSGRAVGVTVALEPPSSDLEVCVAGQVRQLAFPTHAKMDFVNVNF
jgi:hypothetical protein